MNNSDIYLGIDIGGTNTTLGFVDKSGDCKIEASFATQDHKDISKFISHLVEIIKENFKKISDNYICKGMGIAAPHVNFLNGAIKASANLNWGDVNLVELLKPHFNFPIAIINDANAAALGEMAYGAAKEMKNFVVITIGTGFGSGLVINRNILNGANGLAGELGHTNAVTNGRKCACGKLGCLESYVSANGLRQTAFELMRDQNFKSDLYKVDFQNLTSKMISEYANKKDELALAVFEFTGKILGARLADLVAWFDPEAIIMTGGVVKAGELLLVPTRKYFEENLLKNFKGKVHILKSELEDSHPAIFGASLLVSEMK